MLFYKHSQNNPTKKLKGIIMKIIVYFIISLILSTKAFTQDFTQNVHQYMVRQAWQYLIANKPEINWNNSPMASHIGNSESGNPDDPWDVGLVVIGAYREDEEDPVYLADFPNPSMTHFWHADPPSGG